MSGCHKFRFGSRADAKAHARESHRNGTGNLRPYLCPGCGS